MIKENYFLNCHSEESIKIRYRKLAIELHPDKNPDDSEAKANFQNMIDQRDQAIRKIYTKAGKSTEEMEKLLKDFIVDLDKLNFSSLDNIAKSFTEELDQMHGEGNYSVGQIFNHVFGKLLSTAKNNKKLE